MTWSGGAGATSHDIYFGTSDPPPFKINQAEMVYDPGRLNLNATYYWRIDAVNSSGTTTGQLWSFSTSLPDFDEDNDVDQEDFGRFQKCLSGDGVNYEQGCAPADLDSDEDVDQGDYILFRQCHFGPNVPVPAGCLD
jgi:hypothetical protein